ncbi:hypothetical protein ITP53_38315 [Nonomuraea sp. K274]|uniref:Uncharacterized protein n=1 Tax=Nonomuraea cypriaca TaxID=1187855 RepID=A0A931AI40_9ACTN|nr:hypothetical protein [Nonomuraea cypriaca]MBF8191454.1 hypothetical protein [Nonomuraea cypriaca]
MVDPLSFPVLAGAALTATITFIYNRIGAVLDRRAGRIAPDLPDTIEGSSEALTVHSESLTEEQVKTLERSAGTLGVYLDHPELLRGDDEKLRETLGKLRTILELAYDRELIFADKQTAGPSLRVTMRSDEVSGIQRGIKAKSVSGPTHINVEQTGKRIAKGGEMTGVEIDGPIG